MIEIVKPSPGLFPEIKAFFALINTEKNKQLFSPHPFDEKYAKLLSEYSGKDEYYFLRKDGKILGYGMLRGWDEGYETPSLGICVLPTEQGHGLGDRLMDHLITTAHRRRANRIILKVKKVNANAISLYRKKGFVLSEKDAENFVGFLRLVKEEEKRAG